MGIEAYAVVDAGYGDSGKGLMTDYFCENRTKKEKTLNVKVNGGHQAGHTVSRLSGKDFTDWEYQHFVFHSLGSGTFTGADTLLASRFIVNPYAIVKEIYDFTRMYGYNINTKLFIDPKCRLNLQVDKKINLMLESLRQKKHGSCGMGIFETVHRNHMGFGLRLGDAIDYMKSGTLVEKIEGITEEYINARIEEVQNKEGWKVDSNKVESLINNIKHFAKDDVSYLSELLSHKEVKIMNLEDLLYHKKAGKYTKVVFECSQGLELNWGDERNSPHVTASHTGTKNIYKELSGSECAKLIDSFEICYVTRSYKTKHGDGDFPERNEEIVKRYNLFDRTNTPNENQGILMYGEIDRERMSDLINKDFAEFKKNISMPWCHVTNALAVTHLDQTDEAVLETGGKRTYFKEFNADDVIGGFATYYSFGDKARDVVEI